MVTLLRAGKDLAYMRQLIQGMGEKIFVNSMSDTWHEDVPFERIDDWFNAMADFPDKQFQLLTKRTNRARLFAKTMKTSWPKNLWLGTSVEDAGHAFRIKTLQQTIGPKIKFISFEPLLGPISKPNLDGINWIIIGGESGETPRPMNPQWAQDLVDHSKANYPDCAVFFKQMGGKGGDGAGGDVLNGKQYHEFPAY